MTLPTRITKHLRELSKVFTWLGISVYLSCFASSMVFFQEDETVMELSEMADVDEKESGEEKENEKTSSEEADDYFIDPSSEHFEGSQKSKNLGHSDFQLNKILREIETPPPEWV